MKYIAVVAASFEIEAENIAEARRVAKKLRTIGERAGLRRPGPHDRDMVPASARRLREASYVVGKMREGE